MISKYDEKVVLGEAGKRHFKKERKTSLFGSESPRPSKVDHGRRTVQNTKSNYVDGNIFTQNDTHIKDQEFEEKRYNISTEKPKSLQEMESYNIRGKQGPDSANINYTQEQDNNRLNREYEQELNRMEEYKTGSDKSYTGFGPGFGCGNSRTSGKKLNISVHEDGKTNICHPNSECSVAEDNLKLEENNVIDMNKVDDNESCQKYEETKAFGDRLEQEIQRMKLKEMEDKYLSMKNDTNMKIEENEEDSLYKEAENRARLREMDRCHETYGHRHNTNENIALNDHTREEYNTGIHSNGKEIPRLSLQPSEPKRTSSSTHNDFRQYSKEEYMNSRQQLVNPTQLKRTTLSGSEEFSRFSQSKNGDPIINYRSTEHDSINKLPKNHTTYNNIFPSDRTLSLSKSSGRYSMRTPYATD